MLTGELQDSPSASILWESTGQHNVLHHTDQPQSIRCHLPVGDPVGSADGYRQDPPRSRTF